MEAAPDKLFLAFPNDGELGHLKPAEDACLAALKEHITGVMNVNDPRWDDWYLLRFCRARKFVLKDVILMFENFIKFRVEKDVDNMIGKDFAKFEEWTRANYEHGYYGTSKDGYPIYIERYANTDVDAMLKGFSEDELKNYYTRSYELMLHAIFPECSRKAGRRIDRIISILDVKGLGIGRMMKKDMQSFLKMASSVAQDYYPESMGKLYIINTGMAFTAFWSIIKYFLDEKTRKKICVLGGKYQKDLAEVIDIEQLPEFLGGTKKDLCNDNPGPFRLYIEACKQAKTNFPDGVTQGDPWKEEARKEAGYKSPEDEA